MDSQVWLELAEEFDKALSVYNNSPDENEIAPLRPHLRKAGKAYFAFLRDDDPDITTTGEFLVEPVFRNTVDDVGREHRCTDAHDRYWICVLALLGRCGYITVKNKKLREMKIPTVYTRKGIKVDWSVPFLNTVGPREGYILGGYLLSERDYVIDVCKVSIQACQFLIKEYGDVIEKPVEQEQKKKPTVKDDKNNDVSIWTRAKGYLKYAVEKVLQILTKSFWEALFDRFGPK